MTLAFIRWFFIIISCIVGYYVGMLVGDGRLGSIIGALCALILIFLEMKMRRVSVRGLSSMVFGLLLGIVMAKLVADILSLLELGDFILSIARVILTVVFSYLGAVMALRGKDEFNLIIPYVRFKRQDFHESVILLDTSAIIDGRVVGIYQSNFIDGTLLVPRFVLQELHKLSDSSDELKRQKGRRGLEILKNMQQDPKIGLQVHEDDLTNNSQDVDAKLVTLAKMMDARICTSDFNLGKIASLQGVGVLSVHELAQAMRTVVVQGDRIEIQLVKEGKEHNQAIGYLDDGTMVVVAQAKQLIGQKAKVSVTSILQTQAGKIVFAQVEG